MSEVLLEVDAGVATITLAAAERRNALTPSMSSELVEACETVDANPKVGASSSRAAGESFCAGAHRATLVRAANDPFDEETYRVMLAV